MKKCDKCETKIFGKQILRFASDGDEMFFDVAQAREILRRKPRKATKFILKYLNASKSSNW